MRVFKMISTTAWKPYQPDFALLNSSPSWPMGNRIKQICGLFTGFPADLHKDPLHSPAREQLQNALCGALLQSLQSSTHETPASTTKQPGHPPAPCTQRDIQSQPQQQTRPTADTQPCSSDGEGSEHLTLLLDDPNSSSQPAADGNSSPSVVTLASAWNAAGPALQTIYTWEDETIVTSVITFWSDVTGCLYGDWLLEGSQHSCSAHRQQPQDELQQQQRYIVWLQQLGDITLAAVVQLLHDFYKLTGISHAQHKQRTALSTLLLLFLQLYHHSGSTEPGPCDSLAVSRAAQQFLQLVQWPQHGAHNIAASTAVALTSTESFSGVCKLLQTLATTQCFQGPNGLAAAVGLQGGANSSRDHNSSSSSKLAWEELITAAGEFLQTGYGKVPLGMPALSCHISTGRRPEDTAYDCCMLELLYNMYQGPWVARKLSQQQLGTDAASQQGIARCRSSSSKASKEDKLLHEQWSSWCDGEGFRALGQLVLTYDKPHLLTRGLVALVLQQQQQQLQGCSSVPQSAASVLRAEKTAMSKVMQLLESVYLLPYQQTNTATEQAAAAGAVCKLLQGCAGLLWPAANCTVEWRCAALGLMTRAVEEFTEMHQDSGELHSQLWCDNSLEGLLYSLNHDSSIKVRRTAMKLLQLVVLPSGSHAAKHLIKTLAAKVCDKDSTVGQAALELLVQLDAKMICNVLTAGQWSAVVQAGLQLCNNTEAGGGGPVEMPCKPGRRTSQLCASQALSSNGQQQFLGLLKAVLLFDVAEPDKAELQQQRLQHLHSMHGHQIRQWLMAKANKVVGIGGCRIVLLLLLQSPELGVLSQVVADACCSA